MSITEVSANVKVPQVGDKVKALYIPSVTGRIGGESFTGQIVTVTRVDETKCRDSREDENGSGIYIMRPVAYGQFVGDSDYSPEYFFSEWEFVDESAEPSQVDILQNKIHALVATNRTLSNEAINAIAVIGDRLNQEAHDRDWCEIYDKIIEEVNDSIPSWLALPLRMREYEVSAEVCLKVTINTTVEARTLREAIQAAAEDDINHLVVDAVRYNGFYIQDIEWNED